MTYMRAAAMAAFAIGCTGPTPNPPAGGTETALPLRHAVKGGVVEARVGHIDRLELDPAYRYVGGQRFILQNTADAEQHVFADVDSAGAVRRMYWVQFEEMLPDHSGAYNYAPDSILTLSNLPLRVNAGRHTSAPQPGSDRAAMYRLVERAGFKPPLPGTRVRFIYLPDERKRSELMVIYIERKDSMDQPDEEEAAGAIATALGGGLRFVIR